MSDELPEITEIRRVSLKPGDVVVARVASRHLSAQDAYLIRERLRRAFDAEVVVLGEGMEIDVITPEPRVPIVVPHDPDYVEREPASKWWKWWNWL